MSITVEGSLEKLAVKAAKQQPTKAVESPEPMK
jgi:hypothetical protein